MGMGKVEMSKTMLFVAMACALVAAANARSAHSCHFDSELLKGAHSGRLYCPLMEHEGYTLERAAECSLCTGFAEGIWEMSKWYIKCHVNRMKDAGQLQIEQGESDMVAHREWYWEVVSGLHEAEFPDKCPDLESDDDHAPVAQASTRGVPQRGGRGGVVQAAVPARGAPTMRGLATAGVAAARFAAPRRGLEEEQQALVPELEEVDRILAELE